MILNVLPTINLANRAAYPVSGTGYQYPDKVQITATSSLGMVSVEQYGENSSQNAWSWPINVTTIVNTSITTVNITVQPISTTGTGQSIAITQVVSVNLTAPTLEVQAPIGDSIYGASSPTVAVYATSNAGNVTYQLRRLGVVTSSGVLRLDGGGWTNTVTFRDDGVYVLTVTATNAAE